MVFRLAYPLRCVFNTLSFELSATDLLVSLADAISGMEDSLYSFYITINDYCRIENCITAVVWGTDEEILIELDEEERKTSIKGSTNFAGKSTGKGVKKC